MNNFEDLRIDNFGEVYEAAPERNSKREEIMVELWAEAENKTWELYNNLNAQGKLTDYIRETLEWMQDRDPAFCFRNHWLNVMYYYYNSGFDSPYCLLRANLRRENGLRIPYLDRHPFVPNWSLKQDQQYIKLKEGIETSDEIKLDYEIDRNHYNARKLAELLGFEEINEDDIRECLREVLETKLILEHLDILREFCFRLLEEDMKSGFETDYENFKKKMNEKFDSFHLGYIENFISSVNATSTEEESSTLGEGKAKKPSCSKPEPQRKRRHMESIRQEIERKIEDHLEAEKAKYLDPLFENLKVRSGYIKRKLKLAEEIGLITMNKATGLYEEIYKDIIEIEVKIK